MSNTDIVRASFDAYRRQDRQAAERLIAPDFVFTSPQDDHIDRTAFFERCFPTADRFTTQEILELVGAGEEGVFILYEYELQTGNAIATPSSSPSATADWSRPRCSSEDTSATERDRSSPRWPSRRRHTARCRDHVRLPSSRIVHGSMASTLRCV